MNTEKIQKILAPFKNKRNLMIIGGILLIIVAGVILRLTWLKPAPKQVYQAAVMVRSQQSSDPAEDLRSSLKKGDVLVVQDQNHKWSKTESVSYLILNLELTEEQRNKLTMPDEKELDFDDLSEEEQRMIEEEKQRAEEEGREYLEEPRRETLRPRLYYIDLNDDELAGFEGANSLLNGQPYPDKVFTWSIVEKKKSLK